MADAGEAAYESGVQARPWARSAAYRRAALDARRGDAGLSLLDREQSELFADQYADRPSAPLAIVIAAYNEQATVASVIKAVPDELCGLGTEVIVVVDGARDGTAGAAREAGALVCNVPTNRGQGAALRLGYHLARSRGAKFIMTTDADGQYQSADMERVIWPLVEGEADFVSGSRRLGSTTSKDAVRNTGVVVFAALISLLVRRLLTDPSCGLRGMTAELTGTLVLDQPQYQASELLIGAAMAGYRLKEVPIAMKARGAGKSKKAGNFVYGLRFGSVVVGTWWRELRAPDRLTKTQRS
ncbi:MAG TPA: glycosyltransferase family 2 protein [Acidimicrobiales bacterium]|nr:glycosyltransferase family 2 protein [Acidimicrobiales bacterium]